MLQYNPTVSGSLTITGSLTVTNGVIGTVSGVDVQIFSSSINQVISGIQGSTGSSDAKFETLSGVTSSALTRLTNIESKSASVDISISNINSITASNIARLSNLETKSSSVDISITSINSFTSSNANQSLNSKTGSYATTGSNTFVGTTIMSGSTYVQGDLIVLGSSSIQYISASSVSIGTNIVQLNTANPSVRFAGLSIIDSGSVGGSGSFLYDSLQDEFIFIHRGNGTNVTSSHFVLGPETYDSLGNETYLTCNRLTKGTGKEHLVDSCIYESGGCVGINTNSPSYTLDISGSVGRIKNAGGSADFILDRASTSAGATRQYSTAGTLKWYTGLRGLANNSFYIFNNATSTNTLILDETSNNATFACGISVGNTSTFSSCIITGGDSVVCNSNIKTFSNTYGSTGLLRMYGTDGCEKYQQGLTTGGDFYQYTFSGLNHIFYTNGTNERMRISSAGNISVGRCDEMYRLNVFHDVPKTCTTARGLAFFGSNDSLASAPFGLVITAQGGAAIANRVVRMGTTDFGLANGGLLELNGTLFVCNSGCVGIGNSSPNTMLHTTIATPYGTNGTVLNSYPVATFSQCDCASGTRGLQIGVPTGGVASPVYLKITNTSARFSILDQSNCEDFTITGNKVGIGTTSPTSLLHLCTTTTADNAGHIQYENANTGTGANANAQLIGKSRYGTAQFMVWESYGIRFGMRSITNSGAGDIYFTTCNDTVQMVIKGGNLGVGSNATSPRTRLQVTPTNNAEIPVLGCANGIATFTSANTNYGLQFNSTSDGSFHIQSQRFDADATAYALGLNSAGGCVYLGKGWGATNHRINLEKPQGCTILVISGYSGASNDSVVISAASGAGYNGALTVMGVTTNTSTGRSISAGGSITGGGNDYAEYIVKRNDAGCIQKGQIAGIDSCKLLTDKWSLACSFVVKSTDPSFVGGDSWDKHIGNRPQQTTCITDEEFAPVLAEYEEKLEEARNKVDRIAFSGQVPVIVSGSYNVGDYILPIEGPDDTIIGVACSLSNLTLEDYGKTIGKVWGTCLDKAWVAVKIG